MRKRKGPVLWGSDLRVLKLVAEGLDKPEIAARLKLSEHTITRHFYRIKQATGTGNRIKWLLVFGDWIPKADAEELSRTVFAKPPNWKPQANRRRCISCRGYATETETIGGTFDFDFCTKCRVRLDTIRAEAATRKEREEARGRVRAMPSLIKAMQKASRD